MSDASRLTIFTCSFLIRRYRSDSVLLLPIMPFVISVAVDVVDTIARSHLDLGITALIEACSLHATADPANFDPNNSCTWEVNNTRYRVQFEATALRRRMELGWNRLVFRSRCVEAACGQAESFRKETERWG